MNLKIQDYQTLPVESVNNFITERYGISQETLSLFKKDKNGKVIESELEDSELVLSIDLDEAMWSVLSYTILVTNEITTGTLSIEDITYRRRLAFYFLNSKKAMNELISEYALNLSVYPFLVDNEKHNSFVRETIKEKIIKKLNEICLLLKLAQENQKGIFW